MNIICTVDILTRHVALPAGVQIASYDHNVDVIQFNIEPIEDFSLDTSSIKIAAQGPNNVRHDYAVDPSTVQIEEETGYITFDWPIPQGVTEMPIGTFKYGDKGNLIFSVCAEIISGDTVSKAWHSDDGIITVVAHLEPESGGGEDPEEEATNAQKIAQLQTDVAVINTQVGALGNGSPTPVATVAEMTDESAVYLYTGSETGYTAGNWYYYNGSAWTSGGTYGGAVTDTTLSISGSAADAKAVGDALATKADADDVTALDTRVTAVEGDLSETVYTKNVLFTKTGYYINSLGGITQASTYSCSERHAVKAGDLVRYDLQVGDQTTAIGYYSNATGLTGFEKIVVGNGSPISGEIAIETDGYIAVASINSYISGSNPHISISGKINTKITTLETDVLSLEGHILDIENDLESKDSFFSSNERTQIDETEVTLDWIEGSLYNLNTGAVTENASFARTAKFPCKEGDVFVIPNLAGQIVFFKADGTVSYKSGVTTYTTVRSAPANTTHFALNNSDSTVRATAITHKSAEAELIQTIVDAPAKIICGSNMFVSGIYANTTTGNISTGVSGYYGLANYPVKANHKYRTETQTQVIFYDADMAFISAILPGGAALNTGTRVEMDFVTPSNCAYVSINSSSPHEMLFDVDTQVIVGNVINPQKLTGKRVLCFGDSITGNYAFGDNIPYEVEELTGAKTINCGFGGCRMELLSGDSETAQITNPFAMCTIVDELAKSDDDATKWTDQDAAAATFEASPRFNRIIKFRLGILKTVDVSTIDIVTIAYGTNEIGFVQENAEDKYDKYTFGGATRYSIEKLLELNPKLQIVLLTPIYRHNVSNTGLDSDQYVSSHGLTMADNINTLKSVGLEYKMPVIDMYHDLGINTLNYSSYFGDDDEVDDGTHINSYGRKTYGRRLAGELSRLF